MWFAVNNRNPPEIEVLQLTSNANASSKNIGAGFFLILATLILPLLFLHTDDPVRYAKILKVVLIISGSLGITGLLMILFGYWRLQKNNNRTRFVAATVTPRIQRKQS